MIPPRASASASRKPRMHCLQKITDTTIAYLKEKVKAGVNAVQIFDSWGGMLSPVDYQEFSWKYINQIVEALAPETHVIVFWQRLLVCP